MQELHDRSIGLSVCCPRNSRFSGLGFRAYRAFLRFRVCILRVQFWALGIYIGLLGVCFGLFRV